MIITKKALPRRTFLRGMGATVALPLLDAMVPSMTAFARTAAAPVRRLGFVYMPMGCDLPRWTPAGDGTVPAYYSGSPFYAKTVNLIEFGASEAPRIERIPVVDTPD